MKQLKQIAYAVAIVACASSAFAEKTNVKAAPKTPKVAETTQPVASEPVFKNTDNSLPKGIEFGVGVSATSGANVFLGYANKNFESFWWKRLGFRLDYGTTAPIEKTLNSYINDYIDNSVELGDNLYVDDFSITANHFAALVDFYPFGDTFFFGGIRLTAGYMFGNIELSTNLIAKDEGLPSEPMEFELMDQRFLYDGGTISGKAGVNWDYNGPYLGTGFDIGIAWGIKFYMDAGVVFTTRHAQLGLDVPVTDNLKIWDADSSTWKPVDPTLAGTDEYLDLFNASKHDALKDGQDSLDDINMFPMVKLGFMYRF